MTSRRDTPVAFVRAILRAYEDRGLDPAPALGHAGLSLRDLDDPTGHVALEPFEALSGFAMRDLNDEALGWFSRRLPWGSYGMLLRASLNAQTLGRAMERWCRHHNLLCEDVYFELRSAAGRAEITIREQRDLGRLREFCLLSLLRNAHGVASWLADSRIDPLAIHFPFAAPPHAPAYSRMFRGPIRFGAPQAALSFDADYLRLAVVRDDAALRLMLKQPIRLMARIYRQDRLLSQRIIALLTGQGGGAEPDAEAIAERLGTSLRSLQRQLQAENTSLSLLRAQARRARVVEMLRRGDLPIKRIAMLSGYCDESSFSRAFRRWTGQSPAEFRRGSARGGPAP